MNIEEWIKQHESQGYTKEQIKEHLQKYGYSKKELDEVLNEKPQPKFDFKEFLRPTFAKLFIPVVLLIVIFAFLITNIIYAPEYGNFFCAADNANIRLNYEYDSLKAYSLENNAEPQKYIDMHLEIDANISSRSEDTVQKRNVIMMPILLGNLYYYYSGLYNLQPLMINSCEFRNYVSSSGTDCEYFTSKEDYKCVRDMMGSAALPPENSDYKGVNIISAISGAVIFILISYILICLLYLISGKLQKRLGKYWPIMLGILLLISFLWSFETVTDEHYIFPQTDTISIMPLIFLMLLVLFMIYMENKRKLFSFLTGAFIIVLLISGIILGIYVMQAGSRPPIANDVTYSIIQCNNTISLTVQESRSYFGSLYPAYENETVNVCYPRCTDACHNLAIQSFKVADLRGDNPSCVCAIIPIQNR